MISNNFKIVLRTNDLYDGAVKLNNVIGRKLLSKNKGNNQNEFKFREFHKVNRFMLIAAIAYFGSTTHPCSRLS